MDVAMPGGGIEATRRIAAEEPGTAIVMLTASEAIDDLFAAIKAGARGYLLKNLDAAELRAMLRCRRTRRGRDHPRDRRAHPGRARPARPVRGPDTLTDRELDVLQLVVAGQRNKEIAATLGISENTVKFHLRNILDKLHAQSRAEAVARAVREGLLGDH